MQETFFREADDPIFRTLHANIRKQGNLISTSVWVERVRMPPLPDVPMSRATGSLAGPGWGRCLLHGDEHDSLPHRGAALPPTPRCLTDLPPGQAPGPGSGLKGRGQPAATSVVSLRYT